MSAIRVSLVAIVVLAVGFALGQAQAEVQFSGWSQVRYNVWDDDLATDPRPFDLRRARLTLQTPAKAPTSFRLQVEVAGFDDPGGSAIEWKDYYVQQRFGPELRATVGFTSSTFGIEVPASNSKLLPFERSQAALKLFPGEREIGAYLHWKPAATSLPQLSVGYTGGMSKWHEASSSGDKDHGTEAWVAQAQWALPRKGMAGVSYRSADRTRTVSAVDTEYRDDLWGLHLRYNAPQHWALQAEYFDGEDLGVDVNGYYGQAEYALGGVPATVFYRYDVYDSGAAHDYNRHTGGVVWTCSKTDQVTLQAEAYDDSKGASFTNYGVQYQRTY